MKSVGITVFLITLVLSSVGTVTSAGRDSTGPLTLEERVHYQRTIEQVYWQHRIWPKENKTPKPSLNEVMSSSLIRAKVEDYLKKSNALAEYWKQSIKPEQLQAEINRMARESKQPAILRELFVALDNDPHVIAECLARPALVDRLLYESYSADERFHGALKKQIESELKGATVQSMHGLSGRYYEMETAKSSGKSLPSKEGRLDLTENEWNKRISDLQELFESAEQSGTHKKLPVNELSSLKEDAERFYVIAVLERWDGSIKTAMVEWRKRSMQEWWSEQTSRLTTNIVEVPHLYSQVEIPNEPSCEDDTWRALQAAPPPAARFRQTAVWTGTEMIVWGGRDSNAGYLSTGARYNPSIHSWTPTSPAGSPTARQFNTAVWTGTEMIVWGGESGNTYFSSGARYDPLTDNWTPTSLLNVPSPRIYQSAVWTGSEMIVWGGTGSSGVLSTGGRYDPVNDSWTATNTANVPDPRYLQSTIWTGSEMIVWGGLGSSSRLSSGGRYNPSTDSWNATSSVGVPDPRLWHKAVWSGTEMIIWAGVVDSMGQDVATGGRYNPSSDSWTPTSLNNVPEGRREFTAVWSGTEMIVWGGESFGQTLYTGGRYDPSSDSWTPIASLNVPSARKDHSAIWTGTEMIIWGGTNDGALSTGGRYNPETDSWLSGGTTPPPPPSGRFFHTAIWTGSEMIVWGGNDSNTDVNTGGRYDPATNNWTPGGTSTINAPTGRNSHTAIWTGTEMIIWGGTSGNISGGRYNPSTDSWAVGGTGTTNAPSSRYYHTAVWTGSEMIVWGGFDGNPAGLDSGGRYDPVTNSWNANGVNPTNAPSTRYHHTAIWTGSEMIVWGGYNGNSLNTGGRYNPSTNSWAVGGTSTANAPLGSRLHAAIWTGTEMIVWGGQTNIGLVNTGGRYNPSSNSWHQNGTSTTNAPSARYYHKAVWTGSEMIIWGGFFSTYMNTGGRYIPAIDAWTATSTVNSPQGRAFHTTVWTGSEMIVWGGYNGTNYTNSGGNYCAIAPVIPLIAISDSSVMEGHSGTVTQMFDVTLSQAASDNVVVFYETVDDTATASDNDFEPEMDSITIPAGQTSGTITIVVNGDTKFETNERYVLNLTAATHASIDDGQASGTITNDDAPPSLSVNDVSLNETNSGSNSAVFTVSLSESSALDVSFDYATIDGSANAGSDYTSGSGTLIVPAGAQSGTITIVVTGDTTFEQNENFNLTLSNPTNATIQDGTGIGTITNDDSAPVLTINDVSIQEGNSGNSNLVFTVTLTGATQLNTTVEYATANGTAVGPGDYTVTSGILTIPSGNTSGIISVPVTGDLITEPNETFFVNLTNPGNATIADSQGIGTINNDESGTLPTLIISDDSQREGKSGTKKFLFNVTLSAASTTAVQVQYETTDGSATASSGDYVLLSGTLTIPAGMKKGQISISVNGDKNVEPNETFFVNLFDAVGAIIADNQGVGTIQNDD